MNKIKLIIWREFITRVRKPSFLIMTVLGPVLIAGGIHGSGIPGDAGERTHRTSCDRPRRICCNKLKDGEDVSFYWTGGPGPTVRLQGQPLYVPWWR
jgi:ABC-2 type transport system permease protein